MTVDAINPVWAEKYRPRVVEDVVLPASIKKQFRAWARKREVPVNLLLCGGPGLGKTSVARALLEQIESDYITLNGSLHGNIDTLRTRITEFVSSVSFKGGRKFVLIDEADHLTSAVQPALRNFMEQYSSGAGFILTCNWPERIIEPLRGRCAVHEFRVPRDEQATLRAEMFKRLEHVLSSEGVEYDRQSVAVVLDKFFPDLRRVINLLQSYASGGPIDSGVLSRARDTAVEGLVDHMRSRNFTEARKWVAENAGDTEAVFRRLYDTCHEFMRPDSIPQLVLHLGTYQFRASHAVDPEINMAACVAEIMATCAFK